MEWAAFWIALAVIVFCIALTTGIGIYVVTAYPRVGDPARNARRFVIPAAVAFWIAVAAALFWIGTIIALLIP